MITNNDVTGSHFSEQLQSFSQKLSIGVFLIGCIVFIGWIFDLAFLKSVLPGLVTMKTNTALGFVFGGACLWLSHQRSLKQRRIAQVLAALVFLIGSLTLAQTIFGWNLGIDELLFKEATNAVATSAPNRMAPNTALNYAFIGLALLSLSAKRPQYRLLQIFNFLAFLIALLGFLGYAYGISSFYGIGSYTRMAIHTAVAFLLLCLGIALRSCDKGFLSILVSPQAGGLMARNLVLPIIVIPPILGGIILAIHRTGAYDATIGVPLFGVLILVVFAVIIWWNARSLDRIDEQRKSAELSLIQAKEDLEITVAERTAELQNTIGQLEKEISDRKEIETALKQSETKFKDQAQQLEQTLYQLQSAQTHLVQSEKMSSLGQLVAGVAHEINNPVNFIYGNLFHASNYTQDLINLVSLYQQHYSQPVAEIRAEVEEIDLDFLVEDLPKLMSSMKVGAERIQKIVLSLRNFSRLDESEFKPVNIHDGLDSTLMILQNRLKVKPEHPEIQVIKKYGNLPKVECYAGQLNQVFMNILVNAIDALDECSSSLSAAELAMHPSAITISTEVTDHNYVRISIADNGSGIPAEFQEKLFNPFFTTKPIGKGTGMGLSISYQIVTEKHKGKLMCKSEVEKGTEFIIEIPIQQEFTQELTSAG